MKHRTPIPLDNTVPEQRQTIRVACELPCTLQPLTVLPSLSELHLQLGLPALAASQAKLQVLHQSVTTQIDSMTDRTVQAALSGLQQQLTILRENVMGPSSMSDAHLQRLVTRSARLSFDGINIDLLSTDQRLRGAPYLALLLQLPETANTTSSIPGSSVIGLCLENCHADQTAVGGTWGRISDLDLKRLRRFVLLQGKRPE